MKMPWGEYLREESEEQQEDAAHERGGHVDRWYVDVSHLYGHALGQEVGVCLEVAAEEEQEQALEHGGEPHGEHDDEDEGFAYQGAQEDALHHETEHEAPGKGYEEGQYHRYLQPGDEDEEEEGPYGQQLAVCEVREPTMP